MCILEMQFDPVNAVGAGVQKYTDAKEALKERFNGTLPPGSDPTGAPGVLFNKGTSKFYKKVGFLWKSWKEFSTLEEATKANGGYRRKTNRRSQRRRSRRNQRRSQRRSRS